MPPTLYGTKRSPYVRAVLLTAAAIDLELTFKEVDFVNQEQLKPEYLKMNPQHSIPTVDDDGYYIWDSHAINIYLVKKYAKNDILYPDDVKKQGIVNQRLFFSASVLEERIGNLLKPIFLGLTKTISQEKSDLIREAYDFLEKCLEGHDFVAGDSLTIADFSIVASLSVLETLVAMTKTRNPLLMAWFERMKKLPYYEDANKVGSDDLLAFLQTILV